jgi:hypothetical protein
MSAIVNRSARFASIDAARNHYETPFWAKVRADARGELAAGKFTDLLGSSVKTEKGESLNILTAIMYGAQAFAAGMRKTMCGGASLECIRACLGETSGHGQAHMMDAKTGKHVVQIARVKRSITFMENRALFWRMMVPELASHANRAAKLGMVCAARLNGTTDTVFEREPVTIDENLAKALKRRGFNIACGIYPHIFAVFPDIQFYDYTKILNRDVAGISNYHLTYSFDGENLDRVHTAMTRGMNVAVAFRARPARYNLDGTVRIEADSLPTTWQGYPVFNADDTDARFTDPHGVICGLHVKGAKNLKSYAAFIQNFDGMKYALIDGAYARIR